MDKKDSERVYVVRSSSQRSGSCHKNISPCKKVTCDLHILEKSFPIPIL